MSSSTLRPFPNPHISGTHVVWQVPQSRGPVPTYIFPRFTHRHMRPRPGHDPPGHTSAISRILLGSGEGWPCGGRMAAHPSGAHIWRGLHAKSECGRELTWRAGELGGGCGCAPGLGGRVSRGHSLYRTFLDALVFGRSVDYLVYGWRERRYSNTISVV
ncbi:hypothetical protein L227DRAFT_367494 [Lentinus tigrinus ALCF2SS1-6]|uniref:Uncharacterized protein n=1 Tax=Lentinus tigrinus ALCF2SS1-6 TaxID=1328759 RepID=A0A5C2SLF7_9APHY|nr:hypothetical protein L227DRAFT_367494 [Lentinus tigrinus ALCF2SS1-6]